MGHHYLNKLFAPESVAVFGASEKSNAVGTLIYENLSNGGFKGELYPINPKYKQINDIKCYASIDDIGKAIGLVVIATPASTVPKILRQCGEHGVKNAVVISAGFAESGTYGKKLEHELSEVQRRRFAEIFERVGPKAEKHWRKVMAMLSEQIEF